MIQCGSGRAQDRRREEGTRGRDFHGEGTPITNPIYDMLTFTLTCLNLSPPFSIPYLALPFPGR